MKGKMRLASLFFAVLCAFAAAAQELLSVPGPEMGINVIPAARNRWTSQRIQPADESRLATPVVRTDLDLFSLEYGASLKPWSFTVPEAGTNFVWGAASDDPEAMAIRWGKGWCDLTGTHIWLQAEIDSSVPTEWRFVLHTRKGRKTLRKFTVKPGASRVCENLGQFRELSLSDGGVELVVKGAGADVAVRSLVVARMHDSKRAVPVGSAPLKWKPLIVTGLAVST